MNRARLALSIVLALAFVFSTLVWNSPVQACPSDAAVPMGMSQHRHFSPMPGPVRASANCSACLAVLPSLSAAQPHELMPFGPFAEIFQPLSGIDPAIDPPPPRA